MERKRKARRNHECQRATRKDIKERGGIRWRKVRLGDKVYARRGKKNDRETGRNT